jgi:hypothetical protein
MGVARRAMPMRTAKSCGPDLPTLRSSLRDDLASDGGYQARHSEESAKQPLTPLRRECRGVATYLWRLACVLYFICTQGSRVRSSARHSLRPLVIWGATTMHNSGISCRGNAQSYPLRCHARLDRGIQYSRGFSVELGRLWNTGSPGQGRAMTPNDEEGDYPIPPSRPPSSAARARSAPARRSDRCRARTFHRAW